MHLAADELAALLAVPVPQQEEQERIAELLAQFGVLDTDTLKHWLEDWERWQTEHLRAVPTGAEVTDERRLTDIEQLRLDVANLKATVGTLIAWVAQSAASPLSAGDVERLMMMLERKRSGPHHE